MGISAGYIIGGTLGESVSTYNSQFEYDSGLSSFGDTLGDTLGGTFTDSGSKTKWPRLDFDPPIYILPIKDTHTCHIDDQIKKQKLGRSTAVTVQPFFEGQKGHGSSLSHNVPLCRVLLDISSNGNFLFMWTGSKIAYHITNEL